MKYTAELFNKLCEKVGRYLPRLVFEESQGARIHPWQIRTEFVKNEEGAGGYHRAMVNPGTVNAIPPFIMMAYGDASTDAQMRIDEDNLKAKKPKANKDSIVKVYLDERAGAKLSWRKIGADSDPTGVTGNANSGGVTGTFEKVPDFFVRLGVKEANKNLLGEQATTQRLLRACDIVLKQPRVAMTNNVTVGKLDDGVLASVNPGFTVPTDMEPSVLALPKFVPLTTSFTVQSLFFGRFNDEPFDFNHLSTVYALSPPLPLLNSEVDQSWQIFVKYNIHFNLVNVAQRILPRTEFKPITLFVPLAGGVAQPLISEILATNNDWAQASLDFFQQRNLAGRFYAI